jgi:[CysO sulfur-carrier protein]-thiocarboxylate-dependent cysteine synthase
MKARFDRLPVSARGDTRGMEPPSPPPLLEGEFRWRVTAADGWTMLVLEGELDYAHLDTARKALMDLGLSSAARLALDLRGITFMDTSGVRLVLQAMHRADDCGAEFALIRGPQLVQHVLELVGLTEQLRIVDGPGALGVRHELAAVPAPAASLVRRRGRGPGARDDIVDTIGRTPLVELKRLSPKRGVRLWAKLESHNPTGSIKDRVARALIDDAESRGELGRGRVVVEATSGNTGIALAMICARKGYRLRVVMPENVTPERTQLLRVYGAEIEYSPGDLGSNGAIALARALADADPACYMLDQYSNPANPRAHYDGTAVEILEDLDELAAFVAGVGTGGTLLGVGRRLHGELGPQVQIVAAEPTAAGFTSPLVASSQLDRKVPVSNREAIAWTRRLLDEEGLFAGVCSGAAASVAVRVADELDDGNVVFIVCDDGCRYLSSGVHTRPVDEVAGVASTAWW